MQGFTVRKTVDGDLPQIAELEKACFSSPMTENMLQSCLANDAVIFYTVVDEEGGFCGYAGMQSVLDEGDVFNIAVTESYRRQGAGRLLLQALFDACGERGLTSLTLEVRESNAPAIALYEQAGFTLAGVRKNYYFSPRENALILRKTFGNEADQ